MNNQSDPETQRLINRNIANGNAARNQAAADNNALAASGAILGAAADQSRLGPPSTSTAGAGRGSTDALLPGGGAAGGTFVNQLANGARAAVGPPAPNTNSASGPPPPPDLNLLIGPLLAALPPISNGVIVGPAANDAVTQAINNTTSGFTGVKTVSAPVAPGRVNQSYNLYSPQKGARDN